MSSDKQIPILTVRQPWAWAIMHAGKDVENRVRRTHIRGRVAIHSSATKDPLEVLGAMIFAGQRGIEFQGWPKVTCTVPDKGRPKPITWEYPTGVVVGTVEIVDCVPQSASPWFQGPWGYVLRNPRPLANPIPAKGQLGFWYDQAVTEALEAVGISHG